MEFKSLTNIETSFQRIRFFAILFLVACTAVTIYAVSASFRFAEKLRQKIYVVDNG